MAKRTIEANKLERMKKMSKFKEICSAASSSGLTYCASGQDVCDLIDALRAAADELEEQKS